MKIISETRGDTVLQRHTSLNENSEDNYIDTITYLIKPIDTTIDRSRFYFDFNEFEIYFNKVAVIAFCDSIIRNTPTGEETENSVSATGLKRFAKSPEEMESLQVGWSETLLDRFTPLIIHAETKKPGKALVVKKSRNKYKGETNYYVISNEGDTSLIGSRVDYITEFDMENSANSR